MTTDLDFLQYLSAGDEVFVMSCPAASQFWSKTLGKVEKVTNTIITVNIQTHLHNYKYRFNRKNGRKWGAMLGYELLLFQATLESIALHKDYVAHGLLVEQCRYSYGSLNLMTLSTANLQKMLAFLVEIEHS